MAMSTATRQVNMSPEVLKDQAENHVWQLSFGDLFVNMPLTDVVFG